MLQGWNPYYRYILVPVVENGHYLLYWDRTIQTDYLVVHNHPEIFLWDNHAQRVKIKDIAVPFDKNIQLTYITKIQKYSQLKHEVTEMWRVKTTTVHPIVISATEIETYSNTVRMNS